MRISSRFRLLLLAVAAITAAGVARQAPGRSPDPATFLETLLASDKGAGLRQRLPQAICAGLFTEAGRSGVVSRRRFLAGEFSCRAGAGTPWSAVSAVRWEGGLPNVPFQAVVLVMSPAAAETLVEGQLLLGPPNRVSEGRGVIPPDSDVVVFTIPEVPQMGNGRIRPDPESNRELYGKPTQHELLLQGRVVPSTASAGVLEVLNRFSRPPAGT